jgi:hypothetical protein
MDEYKKEAFLFFLCNLRMDMLDIVLSDKRSYNGASKEVFIEKLSAVMADFEREGDKKLIPVAGKCTSKDCHDGGIGYRFIGDKSRNYLDLIIQTDDDDEVLNITYCPNFALLSKSGEQQRFARNIKIEYDERFDFNPPVNFWIEVQICDKACEELSALHNQYTNPKNNNKWIKYINIEILADWVDRYESQGRKIANSDKGHYKAKFDAIYSHSSSLIEIHKLNGITTKAMHEFKTQGICKKKYKLLLRWLVTYEKLFERLEILFLHVHCCESMEEHDEDEASIYMLPSLLYRKNIFRIQYDFMHLFPKYCEPISIYYANLPKKLLDKFDEDNCLVQEKSFLQKLLDEHGVEY